MADTTASIVKLFSGGWSDMAGRRKVFVVAGYAMAALSRPFMGLVTAPWQVLTIRFSDRFGKGVRSAPRDAMVADATLPAVRGHAFGYMRAMDHLGAAIGPALAAAFLWLKPGELRTLFLLTAIPGARRNARVRGLARAAAREPGRRRFSLTLAPFDRNFRWYLVALVVFSLGNSSDVFLLWRLRNLGLEEFYLPVVWGLFHVVKSGGSVLAGRATDRLGPRPLIFSGWIVYAAIYLAFAWTTNVAASWGLFLLYGLFYALTEPAERTLVANLAAPERKGLAFGWFNFTIGVAALPANLLFGWIYDAYGAFAAFGWSAALAVAAVALLAAVGGHRTSVTDSQ